MIHMPWAVGVLYAPGGRRSFGTETLQDRLASHTEALEHRLPFKLPETDP